MRMPIIAGNWKMNKTIKESMEFCAAFSRLYFGESISSDFLDEKELSKSPDAGLTNERSRQIDAKDPNGQMSVPEVLICPPFTSIPALLALFAPTNVKVGAQDVFWEEKGAFTGEVSPGMLKDIGVEYVLVGHSERRQYFGETNGTCAKKVRAVLDHGMKPILCVGESLSQRESGEALNVVETMTEESLSLLRKEEISSLVIAYEPVWAIGTGKEAKPEDAKEAISHIRKVLDRMFPHNTAPGQKSDGASGDRMGDGSDGGTLGEAPSSQSVRVLYGGSVSPSNVRGFMLEPEIDGALVGGASLDPEKFYQLIMETKKVRRS